MYKAFFSTLFALTLSLSAFTSWAHDAKHPKAPNPSPQATVSQVVGHSNVSIAYGRPGVKGREIWGNIVPIGGDDPRPWVAGANGSTIITFERDTKINGQELPAGAYGLHVILAKGDWTIIFSTDSSRYGIMSYTPDKDALRITATPQDSGRHQEWLAYEIEKTGQLTANVNLRWEDLVVSFTVETPDINAAAGDDDSKH